MKLLYFDCFSGISGDMTISSLLSHGIDVEKFKEELRGLSLEGYELVFGTAEKNGIAANTFKVVCDDNHHHHRTMKDIEDIINKSSLNEDVKSLSLKIFRNLADAESKIHGLPPDEVHFHEVGAVDSIIDIVGTAILINMISPDKIIFSSLPVGSGFVNSQHGLIPVPAPATAELLKDIPIYDNGIKAELVTPTGAAIARTIADEFGVLPEVEISSIGYGAGFKDFEIPNVLRTVIGTVDAKKIDILKVLETNIDDMSPEYYQYIFDELFKNGALDVYLTPIIMKKQRPANKLSVICTEEKSEILRKIIFKETSTFGIREYTVNRYPLQRDFKTVDTDIGRIRVKVGYMDGELIKSHPESDDVKAIAEKTGLSIQSVLKVLHDYGY
ncbi:nickel pincer cofactor biosynthesis protein LarC [Thermoanaerobacterium thermosaccharolyticum]|uniref:nickel pincer cofactor biosynthesis protein LarC n=1 Tax=Thermoanaerobacterium thermosaccharolyticum TaxID=1517 RepID=UPI0010525E5E|nr:nickel pincer cofactor biosynthesis protein LarC [Thermoanaerobacterium thermosaccharolyticum]MBE0068901.1 nickel pincer cofactor biosynthesis protein LarC [Thermoanaerobacterium thermosaccharolyticum]MBE0227092.1 nickel pincer cofactor biosynthesis protein LarC [Thermoanaerobacterium thermosaccharolyticum]TCW39588.1 hypothetical protein EDC21_105148 [Thermohydrogenium kirishiense]